MTKDAQKADVYAGKMLRNRRREINMTQEKLGELVGVTFQQMQKYENGTNRLSVSRLTDIAKCLGVPPGYFFEGGYILIEKRTGTDRRQVERRK